jgi:(1->4)-alpha-D-glucan 1-alpha-D-glucosylmutase
MQDGRIKMFLIWRALGFRRENEALFREGRYVPLAVTGGHAENVVAFAREREGKWVVTVAPRFPTGLVGIDQAPVGSEVWGDTSIVLPENLHTTKNVITGQEIDCGNRLPLGEALAHFPAALIA